MRKKNRSAKIKKTRTVQTRLTVVDSINKTVSKSDKGGLKTPCAQEELKGFVRWNQKLQPSLGREKQKTRAVW